MKTVPTKSLERAFAILEFLDGARRGWNISELSRKLGFPKSTTHLIVLTLERLGYLTREPGSRDYSLGLKVYGLGRGLMKKLVLPDMALPHLQWLVEKTRLTAHLAVLEKDQAIYIQKVDGPGLIKFDTYVGKRTNLHCTGVGKVLAAFADPQRQQQMLSRKSFARYTNNTITSAALLKSELMKVRQRGYAIDDQEEELDIRCLAAPVFNQAGEFMAALGLTGTTGQIRNDNIDEYAGFVTEAARKIFGSSSRTVAGGREKIA